jgi:hypothetical protein
MKFQVTKKPAARIRVLRLEASKSDERRSYRLPATLATAAALALCIGAPRTASADTTPHVSIHALSAYQSIADGVNYYESVRVVLRSAHDLPISAGDFSARVESASGLSRIIPVITSAAPTVKGAAIVPADEDFGNLGEVSLSADRPATVTITFSSTAPVSGPIVVLYRHGQ